MLRPALFMLAIGAIAVPAAAQITIPFNTLPKNRGGSTLTRLHGGAVSRVRLALPDDAVVAVTIFDVVLGESEPGGTVAGTRIKLNGLQLPQAFQVDYDPKRMLAGRRYVVTARVLDGQDKPLLAAVPIDLPSEGEFLRLVLELPGQARTPPAGTAPVTAPVTATPQ